MRTSGLPLLLLAGGALLAGCATALPTGPEVMVLPGNGKTLAQFQSDDETCRRWASQKIGIAPQRASDEALARSAAVGTVVGAATGAAVGAAAGNPAMGAAAGSGIGLLGGSVAGADRGDHAEWSLQHRYDVAYMQCMYTVGNQIPVARDSVPGYGTQSAAVSPPYLPPPPDVPPPPAGMPPPPPRGPVR
jgi:hypothetical protein